MAVLRHKVFYCIGIYSIYCIFICLFSDFVNIYINIYLVLTITNGFVLTLIGNDFSYYTPWYVISDAKEAVEALYPGVVSSDGFKSFPSGHTFRSLSGSHW